MDNSKNKKLHYSWVMTGVCALLLFTASAQTMSVNVFMLPVANSMNSSFTAASLVFSLSQVTMAIMAPLFARLFQRYKVRNVVLVAMILQAISLALLAASTNLIMVGISCAVQGFTLAGLYNVLPSVVVNKWFGKYGKNALNIILISSMLGGLAFTPIASAIITTSGWRLAAIVLLVFVVAVPLPISALLIKESPESIGIEPYVSKKQTSENSIISTRFADVTASSAWKTPAFYIMMLYLLGVMYCFVFTNHMVNYSLGIGLPETIGMTAVSVSMAAGVIGRIVLGFANVKWGQKVTTFVVSGLGIISLIILGWGTGILSGGVFVILSFFLGVYLRTGYIQQVTMIYNVFGSSPDYTKISARSLMISGIVCMTGNTLMGAVYDLTGSYQMIFVMLIALAVITIICAQLLYKELAKTGK